MSLCNDCIKINTIPTCSDSWWVATVDDGWDTHELYYRLTDQATGNIQTGTTDPVDLGVVVITFDPPTELMNHYYSLSLYENESATDPIPMMISGVITCCVEFNTFDGTASEVVFSDDECNE